MTSKSFLETLKSYSNWIFYCETRKHKQQSKQVTIGCREKVLSTYLSFVISKGKQISDSQIGLSQGDGFLNAELLPFGEKVTLMNQCAQMAPVRAVMLVRQMFCMSPQTKQMDIILWLPQANTFRFSNLVLNGQGTFEGDLENIPLLG